jgi:translation initiation factor 3 subunit E
VLTTSVAPFPQFLQCLYVNFDFDGAQKKLQACRAVVENDYFLNRFTERFMEEGRQLIFETYCRIHHKIDISMLGVKLGEEKGPWNAD